MAGANLAQAAYLTENSLGRFLNERLGCEIVHNKKLPFPKLTFRPDYWVPSLRVAVEFDGPPHYTKAAIAIEDGYKDYALNQHGIVSIRIPYFIQLDETTIPILFGSLIKQPEQFLDFPHGFISAHAVPPADFCNEGLFRFEEDLVKFSVLKEVIIDSLKKLAWKRNYLTYGCVVPFHLVEEWKLDENDFWK